MTNRGIRLVFLAFLGISFCNGKLETYCLRQHPNRWPQLNGWLRLLCQSIVSCRPTCQSRIWDKSMRMRKETPLLDRCQLQQQRSNKKQKATAGNVIVIEAIREFGSLQRKEELVAQRTHYLIKGEVANWLRWPVGKTEKQYLFAMAPGPPWGRRWPATLQGKK